MALWEWQMNNDCCSGHLFVGTKWGREESKQQLSKREDVADECWHKKDTNRLLVTMNIRSQKAQKKLTKCKEGYFQLWNWYLSDIINSALPCINPRKGERKWRRGRKTDVSNYIFHVPVTDDYFCHHRHSQPLLRWINTANMCVSIVKGDSMTNK